MKTANIAILSLTAGMLVSTSLYAAEMQHNSAAPTPRIQMISGGIGDGEVDAMNAQQKNYSVKVTYAEKTGEYLSNVTMQVRDHNNTLVNVSQAGPIVLLNLKPGSYTLISNVPGDSKTQRITVGNHGLSSYVVHLHSDESQTSSLPRQEG